MLPSRRRFVLGGLGTVALMPFTRLAGAVPEPVAAFEEIPAASSGIHWVHNAARSPQKFLPESTFTW